MSFPPAESYLLSFLKLLGKREKNNLHILSPTRILFKIFIASICHTYCILLIFTYSKFDIRNTILYLIDKKHLFIL